ncbi:MAG: hypothetical protein Q8898_12665 [Bacillota bacterium]|nr:hypothetical protein [Bacillota bacterium]
MHNQEKKMKVPPELMHPFFFPDKEIHINVPDREFTLHENFMYEMFYYHGENAIRPWEQPETAIPLVIKEWDHLKNVLEHLHSQRDQSTILIHMKKGIGLFLQFLYWSNDEAVKLNDETVIDNFIYKPVNVQERLNFLLSRPRLYHSFIQLAELIKEQEKQFVIKMIKKNASRK